MKLDTATLAFGYIVKAGGGTPNWATSLGQSQINEYKINDYADINEILKGIVYKSKSLDKISSKIGKGGKEVFGNSDDSPIILGAVFTKVEINNVLIPNGKFILLITRDDSESHKGRLRLKYGPSNKYSDENYVISNETFFTEAKKTLGLADNACWFISELTVENQDTLKLKAIIVNKNHSVEYEDTKQLHDDWKKLEPTLLDISDKSTNFVPQQIIFYGVPGCGKSHKISEMLKDKNQFKIDSEEEQIARTVFHPDYTNSDFVGQIMPAVDNGRIEYKFTPGPFTKILAKALKHSENQYVLVIEEINRGNAASIFGEIFQLLDRIKSGKTTKEKLRDGTLNTYGEGWSEYFFMNDEINHYILKECNGDESNKSVNISGICFSENTGIRLPPNLSILATMNTSDQNVFTLDNAFQRRWDMKYIPNKIDYEKAPPEQKNQFDSTIGTTKIKWGVFRDVVNEFIANPENSFSNAEDKQLGLFFINTDVDISEKSGNIKEDEFANKVLKYLWNDIFKRRLSESSIFNENIKTFGELVSAFNGEKAFENCFDGNFVESIKEINKELENE